MNIFQLGMEQAIKKHGNDATFLDMIDNAKIIRKFIDRNPQYTKYILEGGVYHKHIALKSFHKLKNLKK
jgi:hypothetical protein